MKFRIVILNFWSEGNRFIFLVNGLDLYSEFNDKKRKIKNSKITFFLFRFNAIIVVIFLAKSKVEVVVLLPCYSNGKISWIKVRGEMFKQGFSCWLRADSRL